MTLEIAGMQRPRKRAVIHDSSPGTGITLISELISILNRKYKIGTEAINAKTILGSTKRETCIRIPAM
jgi:hypothetical protein